MRMMTQLSKANPVATNGSVVDSDLPVALIGHYRWGGFPKLLCCLLLICGGLSFLGPVISQAAEKGTETAKEYVEKGIALLKEKNPEAAVVAFTKATQLDPKDARAFYNLGLAYHFQSGRAWKRKKADEKELSRAELLDKAKKNYLKSLELDDKNLKAYRNLGMIAAYRKDFEAAAEYFKKGKDNCAETAREKALDRMDDYYKIAKAVQQPYISGIVGIDFGMSFKDFRKEVKKRDERNDKFHPYLHTAHFTVNSPDIDRNVVAWFLVDRAFSPLVGMFYSITRPSGEDPLAFLKLRYPKEVHLGARTVDMSNESMGREETDLIWRGEHTLALSRIQVFDVSKTAGRPVKFGRILVVEVDKELSEVVEKRMKRKGVTRDMLKYMLDTSYDMGKPVLDFEIDRLRQKFGDTKKK